MCIISEFNHKIKKKKKRQIDGGECNITHIVSRRKLFLYNARMKNGPQGDRETY